MRHIKYLLVIAVFTILAYSCNKCHNTTYYLSDEQKQFADFKAGSYWIMRDSLTGRRDSFTAMYINNYFKNGFTNEECGDDREQTIITFHDHDLTTGKKIDTLYWKMTLSAQGLQDISLGYRNDVRHVSSRFNLDFTNNNVAINSKLYNNVFVGGTDYGNQYFQIMGDTEHIVLKMKVNNGEGYEAIWELEKVVILK